MSKVNMYPKLSALVVGVIVGVLISLSVQHLRQRTQSSFSVAKAIEKQYEALSVKDLSTEKLLIHEIDGAFLQVLPVRFPRMTAFFDLQGGGFYELTLVDSRERSTSFSDTDLDGNWDSRTFTSGDELFLYGGNSGFPDVVISETGTTARISGNYYFVQKQDDRFFITRDDLQQEVYLLEGGLFSLQKAGCSE